MGRSQNSFIKHQKEKKKLMKKKEKAEKKKVRQENSTKGGDLFDMMAYVDDLGNIVSKPSEELEKQVGIDLPGGKADGDENEEEEVPRGRRREKK